MAVPIRGRYRPRTVIGAGAQGEVVCARDLVHDRLVALKIRDVRSASDREALLTEARTLLNLRPHPSVPLVREDFFDAGRYHIVMDWVEGVDLAHLLASADPQGVPYKQVLGYLMQVADALDHLHRHDPPIVHKDVKPSNIVIDRSGRAVLVDFGLSMATGRPGGPWGTSGYIAPEVSAGEPPRPASDVFSLAATAYFAFTGVTPEPGTRRRMRGVPESLIPRVEAAMARGLAVDPNRRPRSARALVELLTAPATPHNLPAPLTRFVGRERELGDLAQALDRSRLVTLVGPGGVGKTRLAVELASEAAWAYPEGVWLVELAAVVPEFVIAAVAKTFGVSEEPGKALAETLVDTLHDRRLLIILDNCEHVIDAAASVAEALLKGVPGLRILATSRERLDVFGEQVHPVPSLSFPAVDTMQPLEQIGGHDAVRLFCERAVAAEPAFVLRTETAHDVAVVCATLDGIPLALEMAAGRLREMTMPQLASSLGNALDLRGSRTADSRQRTLAATVAWSYDLLDDPAASLFRRLSVFAGGFTVEAVEAVCARDGPHSFRVEEGLSSLVDRSMVAKMQSNEHRGHRFRLLETIRAYARERAAEANEMDRLVDRHVQWFLSVAESTSSRLFGPDAGKGLAELEEDNDNFRLALTNAVGAGPTGVALRLAVALARFWKVRAYPAEGRRWLEAAIAATPHAPPSLRAKALAAAGILAEHQADFPAAVAFGEEAALLARRQGDSVTTAEALHSLSNVAHAQGETERAVSLGSDCLDAWRASGAVHGVASSFPGALGDIGWHAASRGQHEEAVRIFDEAVAAATELGVGRARAYAMLGLATVAEARDELAAARRFISDATAISEELHDRPALTLEAWLIGLIACREGKLDEAADGFEVVLTEASKAGDDVFVIRSMEGLARVAARRGDSARAATLFAAAAVRREALPWPVVAADERWYEAALHEIRRDLGPSGFEAAWARGRAMNAQTSVATALDESLPNR